MPFAISTFINDLTDRILGNNGVKGILRHPIYTAVLIALIIVLILYMTLRKENEPFEFYLRFFIYTTLISICVVFLHNKILLGEIRGGLQDENIQQLFKPADSRPPMPADQLIPVQVNISDLSRPIEAPQMMNRPMNIAPQMQPPMMSMQSSVPTTLPQMPPPMPPMQSAPSMY